MALSATPPMCGQLPATPWTSSSQVSVARPVPSALCVMEGLVSSPASVPGENDRPAETFTNSGEGTKQREEVWTQKGKENRVPAVCLQEDTAGDRGKEQERERTTHGEKCTRAGKRAVPHSGSHGWLVKGLVSRFRVRAPFLCQQHTVVPDTLAVQQLF